MTNNEALKAIADFLDNATKYLEKRRKKIQGDKS